MSCEALVLLPLADGSGRWVALTTAELAAGLERARSVPGLGSGSTAAPAGPAEPEAWLTSQQLAERTGVPDTWWEQAAREKRVPAIRAGKYLRFRLTEVRSALGDLADTA
jgi:excisionase family DNA binding protein